MKKIFLVRHADASNKQKKDFDRKLSKYGKEQLEELKKILSKIDFRAPTIVKISSSARTMETFEIVKDNFQTAKVKTIDDLYLASRKKILYEIQDTADKYEQIVIVGHNPGLSDLIHYLTGKDIQCDTASLHVLITDSKEWKDIDAHQEVELLL